jgi:hypothetical protein
MKLVVACLSVVAWTLLLQTDPGYKVVKTTTDIEELFSAGGSAWEKADPITWGPEPYPTDFRALWDQEGLYVRFDVSDADPWHTMTEQDDHLWEEEVVEIFIDPSRTGTNYAEVEVNPGNVLCDVRMVAGEPNKQMDLSWNMNGLSSRVHIRQDAQGKTTGWTAIAFLPWEGFRSLPPSATVALPPRSGDRWRFNVFRIERPGGKSAPKRDVVFAAWSPPPEDSFHVPEAFRDLVFANP